MVLHAFRLALSSSRSGSLLYLLVKTPHIVGVSPHFSYILCSTGTVLYQHEGYKMVNETSARVGTCHACNRVGVGPIYKGHRTRLHIIQTPEL